MNTMLLSATAETTGLETLVDVVTQLWTWFTKMAGELLATPIFLISVGFFVIGGSIGLVKRIL